jgi:uncharacterized protein YndB with AHSA1/START domain
MKTILACALYFGLAAAALAAGPVTDTSYREGGVQECSAVIDAPVLEVWKAFSTSEGFAKWAVPVTHIDFRVGGIMESSYSTQGKIGITDNIKNEIVSFIPEHLLVIHNVHVPKGAPFVPELIDHIRTIFRFEDLGGGKTRVTATGVGYLPGAGYDTMFGHFKMGNMESLASLEKSFREGPIDWKAEEAAERGVEAKLDKH